MIILTYTMGLMTKSHVPLLLQRLRKEVRLNHIRKISSENQPKAPTEVVPTPTPMRTLWEDKMQTIEITEVEAYFKVVQFVGYFWYVNFLFNL